MKAVRSRSHATDLKFAHEIWVGTIGTGTVATDPSPNTTPPAANRILRCTAKRDALMAMGFANLRLLGARDGTSLVVQPWFYDDTQAAWVRFGAPVTLTSAAQNVTNVNVGNMAGAKFFVQVTTNTGGVSAFAYDFM